MLAEDAIKAAVKDVKAKRAKLNGNSDAAPVEKAIDAWCLMLDACVYAEKRIYEDLLHIAQPEFAPQSHHHAESVG